MGTQSFAAISVLRFSIWCKRSDGMTYRKCRDATRRLKLAGLCQKKARVIAPSVPLREPEHASIVIFDISIPTRSASIMKYATEQKLKEAAERAMLYGTGFLEVRAVDPYKRLPWWWRLWRWLTRV